ncbi:hypothetical protein NFI96_022802, partial [Prochilodus magdalenae]
VAPDFGGNVLKPHTLVKEGGDVLIECRPKMSPWGMISWRKGNEVLTESSRITILESGSLRISNATKSDAGVYICFAHNQFGVASSSGILTVKGHSQDQTLMLDEKAWLSVSALTYPKGVLSGGAATIITTPPSTLDVTVGESIVLPCQVTHDPTLELKFTWFFNEQLIHFGSHGGYFEKVGGHSSGDIMIRNIQMRHAGKYTCAVQTKVDSSSIATDLIVRVQCWSSSSPSSVVTGRCPQDAAHRTLPTGHYPQDAAHRTLPTGRCPQDTTHRTLPTGRCPQDAAHRTLPTRRYPQHATHRTLPTGRYPQGAAPQDAAPQGAAPQEAIVWLVDDSQSSSDTAVSDPLTLDTTTTLWTDGLQSVPVELQSVLYGPPGPPTSIQVEELTDTTATLSWKPGPDNHSPITAYTIQARTPFSLGWQAVTTVPEEVGGRRLTATVIELSPWVEYEFRVLASNALGTGEPSKPSKQARTKETLPKVTPANVSGGGGSRSELVITWEPVPEELQNGPGFGYVVAFRPYGAPGWMQAAVPSPDASKYVFKNESIQPFSKFQVKVGVYNNKGEGPFGPVVTIYSAEEEPGRAPTRVRAQSISATEVEVTWKALPWSTSRRRVLGYELRYWEKKEKEDTASMLRTVGNRTTAIVQGLKGSSTYYVTVRAYNTAGTGPPSAAVNVTTKKPPPSQPPVKVMWNTSNSKIILNWEQVKALENESEVTGYKVLYKQNQHSRPRIMETNTTSVELSLPPDEEYIIQIKPFGEGGEGSSSRQITIPRITGTTAEGDQIQLQSCVKVWEPRSNDMMWLIF